MSEATWRDIGADRADGSWIAVGYTANGAVEAALFDNIGDLWNAHGVTARRIVVDVPIGLCGSRDDDPACCVETDGERSRRCDDLARPVIGPRSSSVFTAPSRPAARLAAEGAEYSEVNEMNRSHTGKGLTQQAANIAPGIVEVEEFLLDTEATDTVFEGHPEVCFRAFGSTPLSHSKKTAPGVVERLSLLESVPEYTEGSWRTVVQSVADSDVEPAVDDVLDALALALTARAPDDAFHHLPSDPPTDTKGLPMEMVYRRAKPFSEA